MALTQQERTEALQFINSNIGTPNKGGSDRMNRLRGIVSQSEPEQAEAPGSKRS